MTDSLADPGDDRLLGSAAATRADRRHAGLLAVLLGAAFLATAPFAADPLPAVPAVVPAYDAAIVILDVMTAVLLYVQYRQLGQRSFIALTCAYVFTPLVVVAHALSFPNAFGPGNWIGNSQTTAWLWTMWHGVFPLFVIAYAMLARRERSPRVAAYRLPSKVWPAIAATVGIAVVLVLVTILAGDRLPELIIGDRDRSPTMRIMLSLALVTHIAALILLIAATRLHRAIDLWIAVMLVASAIDLALSAVLVSGRYQVGFYASRFYGLVAAAVVLALLLRQALGAYAGLAHATGQLRHNEERLRLALEVGRLATWDWDLRSDEVAWNDQHYLMQGYAIGEVEPSFAAWAARVHPEDLEATVAALAQSRDSRQDYAWRFRNRLPDGSVRWCAARGRYFYENGEAVRMIGVMEDVTERIESEQYQHLLLAELQHRVRNTLSVVRSIARRTAASNDNIDDYTAHFDGRLGAFARTQAAVTRDPAGGIDLGELVSEELIAHGAREGEQLRLEGPALRLQPKVAETLGLAVHELATNAVKYGALAGMGGRIDVRWSIVGDEGGCWLRLEWSERLFGREVGSPRRRGFGTELLERSLAYDLGARTALQFKRDGVSCVIELPLDGQSAAG